MLKLSLLNDLKSSREFFNRSTSKLTEADSQFKPQDEMYSVANHVAQVAQTFGWFAKGGLLGNEFESDLEKMDKEVRSYTSLEKARAYFEEAFQGFYQNIEKMTEAELLKKLPDDSMMAGMTKLQIIYAAVEHTAHHRGSLAVYTRLLGKVPPMPYMDM